MPTPRRHHGPAPGRSWLQALSTARGRRGAVGRFLRVVWRVPEVELLETRDLPSTFTWTGGGHTTNWSDANNWGGTAPALSSGTDDLVFPDNVGSGTLTTNNDISASGGDKVNSITFSGGGVGSTTYTLAGNALQLSATSGTVITKSWTGTDTIDINLTQPTNATQTFLVNTGGNLVIYGTISGGNKTLTLDCEGTAGVNEGDMALNGAVSLGAGGLTKTGIGTAYLNSNSNSWNGGVTVSAGMLIAEQNNALGSGNIIVSGGASLALDPGVTTPSTQNLTLNGTGISSQGGLLAVNATFGGKITVNSSASVGASGTLTLNDNVNNNSNSGLTIQSGTVVAVGALQNFNNVHSNPVVISSGATLQVDGNSNTTDVTVNSGAILAGVGTVEIVTLGATGVISPGDSGGSGIGTLTASSVNMSAGGSIDVQVTGSYSGGVQNDTLTVTGTITAGQSSTLTVDLSGLAYGTHSVTVDVVNYGSLANNFGGVNYTNKGSHASASIILPSGKLELDFSDVG